jgi:hypothetical protein
MRLFGTRRAAGVWGIVFVVLLLVSAAMVSVPTAAESGSRIAAYYSAHAQLIVIQQVVGILALGAFIAFALSLPANRWLRLALWVFVATELVTNFVPLVIVLANPGADNAHTLTFVEDLADSAFFISIGLFASAATLNEPTWLRMVGYVIALTSVIRAVGSPLGMTALDQVAPLAFVAFVLLLSVRLLVRQAAAPVAQPTP